MSDTENMGIGVSDLLQALSRAKIYDLGREFFTGMTRNMAHPPFVFSLIRTHKESARAGSRSSAACSFTMGGHTGTHIDALGHFAEAGHAFGHATENILELEDYAIGLRVGGVETTPPILRRGVLLDIARLYGCEVLPPDHEVGPQDFEKALAKEKVTLAPGDVLLIRTGWMRHWDKQSKYYGKTPGINEDGANWIAGQGVAFTGSDTSTFAKPGQKLVHVILLARQGIQIMENLFLEELALHARYEFIFVALPLKIRGGTGSPIRPIAICL